ncbi:FTSH10 [Symbiodinium microadriaticum]|nr:FTSH10 [Symbiodinium microadriaticum]
MDGFNTDENVILLAGTNRADMLDSALTRPGRFDRTINVELPDIKGRKSIFDVHLRKITLDGSIDEFSPRLAALTPGFSGADIANICNEAAIHAGRESKKAVDMVDFEKATDRVIGGLESNRIISPEERRIVAFHEAGHAVAGWYLEHASPLLKVTIVPRSKGSLGYAQYLPKEISLRTKDQISDIICMALAGRAAEMVHFGRYTTGASDDLRKVTQIIYEMVQVYGMNEKVGQLSFPKQDGQWPQEARALAEELFKRTIELMEYHKEDVRRVAELLLKQETISHTDVAKFSAGLEYDEFVSMKKKMDSSSQVKVEEEESKAVDSAAPVDADSSATTTVDGVQDDVSTRHAEEEGKVEGDSTDADKDTQSSSTPADKEEKRDK